MLSNVAFTSRPRFSSGAFSLIELLVVIAICGVLIALSGAALTGARTQARVSRCLSAIASSTSDIARYADNNRDAPPVARLTWSNGTPRGRIEFGTSSIDIPYFSTGYWCWLLYVDCAEWEDTWLCPSLQERPGDDPLIGATSVPVFLKRPVVPSTYLMSAAFVAAPLYWREAASQDTGEIGPQALHTVAFPSEKCLLFEWAGAHRSSLAVRTWDLKPPSGPVSFLDGHAVAGVFLCADH